MEEQKVQDPNNDPQSKDEILNPISSSSSSNSTQQQQQQQKESVEEEELKRLLVPDVRDLPLTPSSAVESNFVPYFAPAMSKRFSLTKLAQRVAESKGASSAARSSSAAKGITIGKKRPRDVTPNVAPSKKGKSASDSKGKGTMFPPEAKKKATGEIVTPPSKEDNKAAGVMVARDGTSANPIAALGPRATMLRSSATTEKILESAIPPFDKKEMEKLDLDQVVSKFFHIIGQAVVVGSSLASRGRELRDEVTLQQGRAASLEGKMARAQKFADDLEGRMDELKVREQQVTEELSKVKDDREAIAEKLVKLEMVVVELRSKEAHSKKLAIEEFKSSDDFQEAVVAAASKYFGEGFDFCKRQIAYHHPDLGIDLEGMSIDCDLIKEEEEAEEKEEEENKEKGEEKGDTSPSLLKHL
ncbi:uncharacterized protein LOC130776032 isoform X1 [Actinidia eriantha]|uniref:uncharacterized protein LOC130776032 isoform X1 n=1 Tax=Actinidia eriantha TaxID=165200 RepID=UPI002587E6BA|nr:uncharacterized protein LOC130776032 isoform X1 [Actinidia eriantha]